MAIPAVRTAAKSDCDDRVPLLPLGVCRTVGGLLVNAVSSAADPALHAGGGPLPLTSGLGSLTEAVITAGKLDALDNEVDTIVDLGQGPHGLFAAARSVGDLDEDCEADVDTAATFHPADCTDSGETSTQSITAARPGRVLPAATNEPPATLIGATSNPAVLAMTPGPHGTRVIEIQPVALRPIPATIPNGD